MNRTVVLLTSRFPFLPGEYFLESEMKAWSQAESNLIVMPTFSGSTSRKLPKNIKINDTLHSKNKGKWIALLCLLKSLVTSFFYRELCSCLLNHPSSLFSVIISSIKIVYFRDILESFIKQNSNIDLLFYTYWHTEATYALQLLKKDYGFGLVSRAHGFDVYEERKTHGYMPFRRRFLDNIDRIYACSNSVKQYIVNRYSFARDLVDVAYLGVDGSKEASSASLDGELHVVSCSNIVKVKRVEIIVDVLHELALSSRSVKITWTHIGGGELIEQLKYYANKKLQRFNDVNFEFLGELENKDVIKFYAENSIDVFVNVSSSEGLPVSIMEAMSMHIPVVAPAIGGIPEIVNHQVNGVLVDRSCSVPDLVSILSDVSFFKDIKVRENAYLSYKNTFDASVNYEKFVKDVVRYIK